MNVTVVGTGFVGVVSAAVFADFGNQVTGLDVDPAKVRSLSQGKVPFFEPNLDELVEKNLKSGRLSFTTSYSEAIKDADVILLAVGTPSAPDGQADLTFLLKAASSLAPHLKPGAIVAIKSTVPPGTNTKLEATISPHTSVNFYTASLPEFLREGTAVEDTLNPDRVVIGATDQTAIDTLLDLHRPLPGQRLVVKPESAQMSKYAANAYLAQRITFINQIANLCERNGADVEEVIQAIGFDRRIGHHYWYPGLGYGGSCFPKDVRELAAYSKSVNLGDNLFVQIDRLNQERIPHLLKQFSNKVGGFKDKKVAVLGLSFKPDTDDLREAPSLIIIPWLQAQGAHVIGYDPQANNQAKKLIPNLVTANDPYRAISNTDIIILLVEWRSLKNLDLKRVASLMKGNILIDTRNQYSPAKAKAAGLAYISIGRSQGS